MRQVGTLANQRDAERFADYLVAAGMPSRVDGSAESFGVWVIEENDVERASNAWRSFWPIPAIRVTRRPNRWRRPSASRRP